MILYVYRVDRITQIRAKMGDIARGRVMASMNFSSRDSAVCSVVFIFVPFFCRSDVVESPSFAHLSK